MKQSTVLNSRQRELLRTLLIANHPVSYKELSEIYKRSTRTIQREVKSLTSILEDFELKIGRKIGAGLELKGSTEGKNRLKELVEQAKILTAYSPEERQEGITYDLLLANEPIKQYVFSKKYGVSEATVSYDLDKVSLWLKKGGVTLVRTPGIGIYIDGTEQQRRTLLSRLLHKDITFEDWLELFQGKKEDESLQGKLGLVIRNRLLRFVQTDKILDIDRVLHQVLKEQSEIVLTERNYVNLIVHVMLAMERIQSGKVIEDSKLSQCEIVDSETYSLAEKMVVRLEEVTSVTIPKIEVNYISLHLAGSRLSNGERTKESNDEEFMWIELSQSFIRAMEYYLEESFEGDQLLFDGLISHFAPAFNRLKNGLQIHNPMLEKIQRKYPDIFSACQKACVLLSEKTGYHIPEDEIGYLAMHIGSSLMRKKENRKIEYKAIVVCASGLGTSTYLATRIRMEMPNLHVEAIVSMNELEDWLQEGGGVDVVISTINLPFVKDVNVVVVSPFLQKKDLVEIHQALTYAGKQLSFRKTEQPVIGHSSTLLSLAKYGEGMAQILRNLCMYKLEGTKKNVLSDILERMKGVEAVSNIEKLTQDLKIRERQGGFVLGDLAMIHTKSKGVNSLLAVLFRMEVPVLWTGDDGENHAVHTVLLLAVPMGAAKEHTEVISEIPAMFVDASFVNILSKETVDIIKTSLENVLSKAYEMRITSSIREFQGK